MVVEDEKLEMRDVKTGTDQWGQLPHQRFSIRYRLGLNGQMRNET